MKIKFLSYVFFILILTGCFTYGNDRHEAFINMQNYYIGKTIESYRRSAGISIGVNQLTNGNFEEEWRHYGNCRIFFEYLQTTKIIKSWRFTGSKTDCVWKS